MASRVVIILTVIFFGIPRRVIEVELLLNWPATITTEAFTVRAETDIVHQLDSMAGGLDQSKLPS